MRTTILLFMTMALTTSMFGQKMKYSLKKQQAIYKIISNDKKVQKAAAKFPKAQRKIFLEKMSIFYALSEKDQKYVTKICYKCLKIRGLSDKVEEPNYQTQGWVADAGAALGGLLGLGIGAVFGEGVGAAPGAVVGVAAGKAVGAYIEEEIMGEEENDGVVARPDGTDCGGNGQGGFPF